MKLIANLFAAIILVFSIGQCGLASTIYFQDWESGDAGWYGLIDHPDPPGGSAITTVDRFPLGPTAYSGTWVQRITENNSDEGKDGYNYFSGKIPVVVGQTYNVGAWIYWSGGEVPFLGVHLYDSSDTNLGVYWIAGVSGYVSNHSNPITPVEKAYEEQWHWYSNQITIPTNVSYIRIRDKIWGYGPVSNHVDGPSLSYFDNITVSAVPLPGALVLGGIGVGVLRLIRRRRSLV